MQSIISDMEQTENAVDAGRVADELRESIEMIFLNSLVDFEIKTVGNSLVVNIEESKEQER
tara:strand:+ start:608 stop:790 length:183 start_codon:yes stop_codon:yes gene_type:complete